MTIQELHKEWYRLGALSCVKATPTAYKDLKDWEAAHSAEWEELIAHDLDKKRAAPSPEKVQ